MLASAADACLIARRWMALQVQLLGLTRRVLLTALRALIFFVPVVHSHGPILLLRGDAQRFLGYAPMRPDLVGYIACAGGPACRVVVPAAVGGRADPPAKFYDPAPYNSIRRLMSLNTVCHDLSSVSVGPSQI